MASLSKDILVSSIESEIQRVTDDLRGVEENLKRLTGRDFTEPRGERRTRVPSTGGREDEPLPKRRPPGGVFARLGEPVSENHRGRRVHEVVEENDAPRHKPSLASSVARPVVDGKSRTEAAAELSKDKVSRERNRRMFGALLGTLQRFRTDEAKQKGKDDQRAKIERKLEEKGRAEKEELLREKMNLISQRKERQALIRRLNFKIERVKEHEAWEVHQKLLENFIRTHNKPCIFWLPKVHQSRTLHLRTQTKNIIERELEEKRMRLKEELDKVLGGKLDAAIRAEEEGDDEEMENGRGREREENSNVDFNNGSDLLDYDAEEGELVFEEDLLLPGKTSGVRKGGSGRGERVVVQVASGLASRPGAQRRVEVVTVSAAERSRRVRGADREAGNESEKENVAALRGRLTVAAAPHTLPPVEPLPRGVRKKENGVALDRGKPAGGRVREREREKEKKGRDKEKDEKEKSSKGGKGKSGNKREEESRSHRKTESVVKDVPERHSKRGERKHHKETKEGESEAKESPLKDKEEKRPSHVESTDVTEPHIPSEDEDKEQEEQDREEEHEQEQEEQEQEETRAEDLSHISLPLDPEPMLEAENDPPPTTGVTEVVVQHVPMEGGGTTDDDAADASGDASEMRVETVLIDTTAIKKDKTEWDQSTTFVMRRPIVIKQEKDASPARHPKVEPGETQPAKNAKAADESSSDSSSDDSSSDSEDEEEEEEEEEGEDEDAATKGEAASSGSNSSATSSASSSASSSDSESSSSSDSESDDATTGKRKKSDGDRGTTKKRRKREDSSDSSDSSSSSEDEKKKKKKKKEKETISPKKKALSGGGGSKGSSRGSRRDAKEAKGGEKRDERRKGGASKSRSRSRDRDRRRRKSRSKSREKRSRSRDRRRERSKSKDRRRSRR